MNRKSLRGPGVRFPALRSPCYHPGMKVNKREFDALLSRLVRDPNAAPPKPKKRAKGRKPANKTEPGR